MPTKSKPAASSKSAAAAKPKPAAAKATRPAARASAARLKDPKGGLTAAGRKHFAETEGAHLRPGVTRKDSELSLEDMKRKASFLRRHYGRKKPFALFDKKGEPTRYALQAHAWGEKVPKTAEDIQKLAAKGQKLLEKAHRQEARESGSASSPKPTPKKKPARKPSRAS